MAASTTPASDAWESLFRTHVAMMRVLRQEIAGTGMTMNEFDVLHNIAQHPNARIHLREFNDLVLITQSSVSRLIDRLVARGLVAKCNDELDARSAIVSLTDRGRQEFLRVAEIQAESIERHIGGALSEAELRTLQVLSDHLRAPIKPIRSAA